jgi:hypothetical protein
VVPGYRAGVNAYPPPYPNPIMFDSGRVGAYTGWGHTDEPDAHRGGQSSSDQLPKRTTHRHESASPSQASDPANPRPERCSRSRARSDAA